MSACAPTVARLRFALLFQPEVVHRERAFFRSYDPKERRWYRRLPRFLHKWAFVRAAGVCRHRGALARGAACAGPAEGMAYFRIGIVVRAAVARGATGLGLAAASGIAKDPLEGGRE